MKLLILLSIIFSHGYMCSFTPANASTCKNWISQSEFQKSQAGEAAKPNCKKNEKCFCYDGIDLRDAEIKMVTEDLLDRPIYDIKKPKLRQVENKNEIGPMADTEMYCDEDYELYQENCRKLLGYEQSEPVEKLVISELEKSKRIDKELIEKQKLEAENKEKEKIQEAFLIIAEELSKDENGDFLSKEEMRLRAKSLKEKK